MRALTFEPLIPPALWVTLAALLLALLLWYGVRRPTRIPVGRWVGALLLSALAAATVLFVLLNPTWNEQEPPPAGKPQLTVLVDRSASMATPDVAVAGGSAGGQSGVSADHGGRSREAAAIDVARSLARLADRFDVRTLAFDAAPAPAGLDELAGHEPNGALTDLAAALRSGLDQEHPAGAAVALLSDGIHNANEVPVVLEAARLAKALAAPVYTVTLGGEQDVRDAALDFVSAQELASAGQKVPVRVVVRQRGLTGATAKVVLRYGEKEVGRQEVLLTDAAEELRFEVQQATTGLYRYEAEIEPFAEEVTRVNNTATFVLRVVDQPIRVLLLEGKPYWDAKFLLRTLAADPLIELHSLVRVTDKRIVERTLRRGETEPEGGAPATQGAATSGTTQSVAPVVATTQPGGPRAEDWRVINDPSAVLGRDDALKDTQIIVLGRDAEVFLTEPVLARLRDWIAHDGGSLVCYRGAPVTQVNQQLARLLPVQWAPAREARIHVKLTERGRDLRWFPLTGGSAVSGAGAGRTSETGGDVLPLLPTLATVTHVEKSKPLAVVLAAAELTNAAEPAPAVTYQQYGAGRVVVVEGAGMWRWAFLAPQYKIHDDVYRVLWHSVLRWLVSNAGLLPGQNMALRADKVSFSTTETASATLLLREQAGALPTVELISADESSTPATAAQENAGASSAPTTTPAGTARVYTPVPLGDEPGAYRVIFGKLPEGRYNVRVMGPGSEDVARQTTFDVRSFLEEKLDLKARPDLMARIAAESGGAVLSGGAADPQKAADELAKLYQEHAARSRPPRVHRLSAWDRWWLLMGVFALWTGAWALRRSGGLV